MTITTIDEHSFCAELLPENANILDAGCRGMGFANYFRGLGHKVLAIDIDVFDGDYMQCGIGPCMGAAKVSNDSDVQARKIKDLRFHGTIMPDEFWVFRLQELEQMAKCEKFDLIKLDVEGEEFHILGSATHPIAKQVSVEFHAHTGTNDKEELDLLLDTLSQWYDIYNRVWEKRHGCSENYWDVLLVAK